MKDLELNRVKLIINEYVNKENNWLLTEIEVQLDGNIIDRQLQVVNMSTGKRTAYIDDVWVYEWKEIENEE